MAVLVRVPTLCVCVLLSCLLQKSVRMVVCVAFACLSEESVDVCVCVCVCESMYTSQFAFSHSFKKFI